MDLKQRRSRMQAHLDRDAGKQWVHQAANLHHGDGVLTATHDRPILIPQRMAVLSGLATTALLDANRFSCPNAPSHREPPTRPRHCPTSTPPVAAGRCTPKPTGSNGPSSATPTRA